MLPGPRRRLDHRGRHCGHWQAALGGRADVGRLFQHHPGYTIVIGAGQVDCSIPGEGSSSSLRRGNLQFQAIQRAINRHIELTTMCDSLRRMPGVAPAQQDPGNNQGTRTKNIINAAIECLMHDEDLIARKRSGQFSHRGVLQRRRF